MFYAERASAPTRAFSPRQLPTDHGHAVSTREYQSDQSSRKHLRCHRLSCPDKPLLLRAHQQERVPPTPPVDNCVDATTVLGCKVRFAAANNAAPLQPVRRSGRTNLRRAAPAGTLARGGERKRPVANSLRSATGLKLPIYVSTRERY